jgi:prepilin-type processing-associated H-X9-DG protein
VRFIIISRRCRIFDVLLQRLTRGPCNYAINKNVEELGTSSPPDMVLLFETNRPGWCQDGGPEILTTNHHNGEGCNILFVDGHVEFVRTKDLNRLKWTPNEKTQFFTER